ncbi:MAG: hypothetical protein KJO55_00010 [Gammaproteobacteria bacterium]|nr:hypothetical protein [Gammaproteobacteria bacterium]NND58680.1 hypothetical protein [Gammaproteobacteria bacterium]
MNWKVVIGGGLAFFAVSFLVGSVTGMVIHTGILTEPYQATSQFWRPELRQDPPDIAALMPLWIFNGIVLSLVIAALYNLVRPAFTGAGWKKGLTWGLMLATFVAAYHMSQSGNFDLPGTIWVWWTIDVLILFALSGIALGVVADKLAPPG